MPSVFSFGGTLLRQTGLLKSSSAETVSIPFWTEPSPELVKK